jgi:signal transduction histidine kinase
LSALVHELHSPLGAIRGAADLIQATSDPDKKVEKQMCGYFGVAILRQNVVMIIHPIKTA